MLLKAIQIMLENIHVERSGDWKGHFASPAKMLSYFLCTNKRKNYYRWLPVCLLEMRVDLPEKLRQNLKLGIYVQYMSQCVFKWNLDRYGCRNVKGCY